MRVDVDSSALLKRTLIEPESGALEDALARTVENEGAPVSSSLAWIEVSRALRRSGKTDQVVNAAIEDALSGIA